MQILLITFVQVLLCGVICKAAATHDGIQRLPTTVNAFVNNRLIPLQALEKNDRGLVGSLCDEFGSDFMDKDLDCKCNDSTDTNTLQIECVLEAECAYGGSICSDDSGTVTFIMEGFDELATLMEVDVSQRQKSYDLDTTMSSCTSYLSPNIGKFCFKLPMTNIVYLTADDIDKRLKTGTDCEITLDGKECVCEMDREDEYTGDGEEPCFKTDCSAVLADSFTPISICKVVIDSQNKLHKSFLLPFREKKSKPTTEDNQPAEEVAVPSTDIPEDTPTIATSSAGDDSKTSMPSGGGTSASTLVIDVVKTWHAFAMIVGMIAVI